MMSHKELSQDLVRRDVMKLLTSLWDQAEFLATVNDDDLDSARAQAIVEGTHQILNLVNRPGEKSNAVGSTNEA